MAEVFVALGSNLGDRAANLAAARDALARILIEPALSSIYETEPWGPPNQGRYLNQVMRGTTALAPRDLLENLQDIERSLGRDRRREERYGPRTIDLDILLYDDLVVEEPGLQIPHPRMMERAFVLVPLVEIAPDRVVHGVRIKDALARLDRAGVAISPQTA
ncbi:MAG TPA: 2-amino-4-hydroxy-6-hydroxymethyldihydropteridine diphosphokinase [Xanthobacteraceae bacterium]|jgi:2-amino-4-hydroxy-6-hydroxymethyldihydropteridine diphosphokinase